MLCNLKKQSLQLLHILNNIVVKGGREDLYFIAFVTNCHVIRGVPTTFDWDCRSLETVKGKRVFFRVRSVSRRQKIIPRKLGEIVELCMHVFINGIIHYGCQGELTPFWIS